MTERSPLMPDDKPRLNTGVEHFIEYVGNIHVRANPQAYGSGDGLFSRTIRETGLIEWEPAHEYGFMAMLFDELVTVSERRRINRSEKGLIDEACASLVDRLHVPFMFHATGDPYYAPTGQRIGLCQKLLLVRWLGEWFGPWTGDRSAERPWMARAVTGAMLARERDRLFRADVYTHEDTGDAKGADIPFAPRVIPRVITTSHPMHTFVEWLDELDHERDYLADDEQAVHSRKYDMRRRVVALHRVGMAMLPSETWHDTRTTRPARQRAPLSAR